MRKITVSEYDVIYISYDEPNADRNYAALCNKIPWAKRVHGVKGSDAAHKAAAKLSTTDRFITIDGDNVLTGKFLNQVIEVPNDINFENCVISWPSYNVINGLMYGNGGIKCWPRHVVEGMRTHELADADNVKSQIDFCWDLEYLPLDKSFSEIHNNGSALQAWRAGFREGVKMSLEQGQRVKHLKDVWPGNYQRLGIWSMVGADVEHGIWSILGARQGCYMTHFTDWNFINVRNFDYLNAFFYDRVKGEDPLELAKKIGNLIKHELPIDDPLTAIQSKWFKTFNFNITRKSDNVQHYSDLDNGNISAIT
jgi:hypothetical protein